jgi:hypothetical protein
VDWDRVKGLVSRVAARLAEGDKVQQERADALEECLRYAEQARQAREIAERLAVPPGPADGGAAGGGAGRVPV